MIQLQNKYSDLTSYKYRCPAPPSHRDEEELVFFLNILSTFFPFWHAQCTTQQAKYLGY